MRFVEKRMALRVERGTAVRSSCKVNAPSGLVFYPLPPCRIMDTRLVNGPLGGPILTGAASRTVPVLSSSCGLPAAAVAYSLNVTVVPQSQLTYLTVWQAGTAKPLVATLNSDGRTKANATIVANGSNGSVSVYAADPTHVILDVNGYFQ